MICLYFLAIPVAVIGIFVASLLQHPYPRDHPFDIQRVARRDRQNVIITGANSGLGFGTVQHLAKLPNFNIIMACRSLDKCEAAKNDVDHHDTTSIECLRLDLASKTSIEEFAQTLKSRSFGDDPFPVHVLINNAGLANFESRYIDGANSIIYVNQLGHFYLTHLLWDSLVETKARIVSVSSIGSVLPLNATSRLYEDQVSDNKVIEFMEDKMFNGASYIRSKRTNLYFCNEMYHRYSDLVETICAHPGYTRTPIFQKTSMINKFVRDFIATNTFLSMSILEGSMPQVRAALDPNIVSGDYIGPKYWIFGEPTLVGRIDNRTSHYWGFTREESTDLWENSLKLFGLAEFGKA